MVFSFFSVCISLRSFKTLYFVCTKNHLHLGSACFRYHFITEVATHAAQKGWDVMGRTIMLAAGFTLVSSSFDFRQGTVAAEQQGYEFQPAGSPVHHSLTAGLKLWLDAGKRGIVQLLSDFWWSALLKLITISPWHSRMLWGSVSFFALFLLTGVVTVVVPSVVTLFVIYAL